MALLALTRDDYPGIDPADVGSIARRGFGTVDDVRIHCIVSGATAYLAATIAADATSLTVDDASRFPAAPFNVQISGEIMSVATVTGETFSGIVRGLYETAAAVHAASRTVYEVRTQYVYQVSDEPVKAIAGVKVAGIKQSGTYTAYTGQAGDAHPDFPGEAVVAFDVAAFVGQQINSSNAIEGVSPYFDKCTDDGEGTFIGMATDVPRPGSFVLSADSGPAEFWASWPDGIGTITSDNISVDISAAAAARVRISARNYATGATLATKVFAIAGNTSGTYSLLVDASAWTLQIDVRVESGEVELLDIRREVDRGVVLSGDSEGTSTATAAPVLQSHEEILSGVPANETGYAGRDAVGARLSSGGIARGVFDATDLGTIYSHEFSFSAWATIAARFAVLAINGTTLVSRTVVDMAISTAPETQSVVVAGATWATHLAVVVEYGEVLVSDFSRSAVYLDPAAIIVDALASTATSARVVIGERVTVDAQWHYDPDGNYGGSGNLIERPDWAIKYFLMHYMDAAAGEIDAASFTAAGALFASAIAGGYKLGMIIPKQDGWETLKAMSFCSRSTTRFLAGKYYCDYTPDTAPTVERTLTRDDLRGAGARYVFAKDSIRSVFNDLTLYFEPNYSGDTSREVSSGYLATAALADAASVAKYGTYPTTYYLPFVRFSLMAEHVLAHHLLETAAPLLTVKFQTTWKHADLMPGQTIEITNTLYTGRSWYVEGASRASKFSADVIAKEWW